VKKEEDGGKAERETRGGGRRVNGEQGGTKDAK